jgi:hypothetical protein
MFHVERAQIKPNGVYLLESPGMPLLVFHVEQLGMRSRTKAQRSKQRASPIELATKVAVQKYQRGSNFPSG